MSERDLQPESEFPPYPLEAAIQAALRPGKYISYDEGWDFVEGLGRVKSWIDALVERAPDRAVGLFERFLADAYEKTGELDDSRDLFGEFFRCLFCSWIHARQKSGCDSEDTVARILSWMDEDEFGFSCRLETEVVGALDPAGVDAYSARAEAAWADGVRRMEETGAKLTGDERLEFLRGEKVLRAVSIERLDPAGYLRVAERAGLTTDDCVALAEIEERRGETGSALAWVDRAIATASFPGSLGDRRRRLLRGIGRDAEALESAWSEFRAYPSAFRYLVVIDHAPPDERHHWREQALSIAETAARRERISLLLELGAREQLVAYVRDADDLELEALSHTRTTPAAEALEESHPGTAARLWQSMALRILVARKSKYYEAALENLARARRCYERARQRVEWEALVARIRRDHRRKKSFMPYFESLCTKSPEAPVEEMAGSPRETRRE